MVERISQSMESEGENNTKSIHGDGKAGSTKKRTSGMGARAKKGCWIGFSLLKWKVRHHSRKSAGYKWGELCSVTLGRSLSLLALFSHMCKEGVGPAYSPSQGQGPWSNLGKRGWGLWCHFKAVWPWANCSTSLSLKFPLILMPTSQCFMKSPGLFQLLILLLLLTSFELWPLARI